MSEPGFVDWYFDHVFMPIVLIFATLLALAFIVLLVALALTGIWDVIT